MPPPRSRPLIAAFVPLGVATLMCLAGCRDTVVGGTLEHSTIAAQYGNDVAWRHAKYGDPIVPGGSPPPPLNPRPFWQSPDNLRLWPPSNEAPEPLDPNDPRYRLRLP